MTTKQEVGGLRPRCSGPVASAGAVAFFFRSSGGSLTHKHTHMQADNSKPTVLLGVGVRLMYQR